MKPLSITTLISCISVALTALWVIRSMSFIASLLVRPLLGDGIAKIASVFFVIIAMLILTRGSWLAWMTLKEKRLNGVKKLKLFGWLSTIYASFVGFHLVALGTIESLPLLVSFSLCAAMFLVTSRRFEQNGEEFNGGNGGQAC